jgi:hypothetical protein
MKEIDSPNFRLVLHDNLIKEVIVKKNCRLNAQDVWHSLELSEIEKPGAKWYVIVMGEDGSSVANEARTAAASEKYNNHTAALALMSENLVQKIAGNLFLKVNRPRVPVRFFERQDKAMEWLRDLTLKK